MQNLTAEAESFLAAHAPAQHFRFIAQLHSATSTEELLDPLSGLLAVREMRAQGRSVGCHVKDQGVGEVKLHFDTVTALSRRAKSAAYRLASQAQSGLRVGRIEAHVLQVQ